MLVFEERLQYVVPGEKPLGARTRTNNKLNPHLTPSPGIEPGPHWWEAYVGGEFSTTVPSLLPQFRQELDRFGTTCMLLGCFCVVFLSQHYIICHKVLFCFVCPFTCAVCINKLLHQTLQFTNSTLL